MTVSVSRILLGTCRKKLSFKHLSSRTRRQLQDLAILYCSVMENFDCCVYTSLMVRMKVLYTSFDADDGEHKFNYSLIVVAVHKI